MHHSSSPVLAICGSFSFDSVLSMDGRPIVGKVGGNALWSALGAHIAGVSPRILTLVGTDYPSRVLSTLSGAGLDVSAVIPIDRPHPVRITFAHLADGGRVQPVPAEMIAHLPENVRAHFVDTTIDPATLRLGAPQGFQIPEAWLGEVDHWHLPLLPLERHRSLVGRLTEASGTVQTDCPARSDLLGDPYGRLALTLPDIDVFLPSTSDFDVVAAGSPLPATIGLLQQAGARSLVVKAGPEGAFVVDGPEIWRVPAHPDAPVDPTGAGDAFCGGFLVGRALQNDPVAAAALGAASASFAVATEDPLELVEVDPEEVRRRAREILAAAHRVELSDLPGTAVQEGAA
ncbi:carbohydrate kinase family protein [Herbiconiux moechotypicola]|uniref:Carbohydrate kinase PfkB domain-containing protein n=1 Tax=Herbiconiux moechotypicola TaxID=637393 RepID=A0ABP5QCA9_9MICO|nr:carbohydrate kinase family protein [Herbiconiux moechotypicola]MCS5729327.1 carbohydrate kinase family protein [Herbiconiux moechotypicola]